LLALPALIEIYLELMVKKPTFLCILDWYWDRGMDKPVLRASN
jgi:hypothetical protein